MSPASAGPRGRLEAMSRPATRYPAPPTVRQRAAGWRSRLAEVGWVLLPARLFLGATFLFAGLQKLADPNFLNAGSPTSIQSQLATYQAASPIGFLLGPVAEHAVAFGVLTALAEIAVGLGTLLGLWARVAAAGGFLLSTSFFLTVSWHTRPYYYGSDIFVMVMWLPLIAVGAAGVLSLDARLRRAAARELGVDPAAPPPERRRELDRRTVVRGAAAAGVVAAGGAALAGADSALGRWLARTGRAPQAAASPTPPAGGPPTPVPGSGVGPVLARVADVPVGGAVPFQDPGTGQPALVVRPSPGTIKAFSAVCTHAGCTVGFDGGTKRFVCPCHGSLFDGSTGQVLTGPAPSPLPAIPVVVAGGEIRLKSG